MKGIVSDEMTSCWESDLVLCYGESWGVRATRMYREVGGEKESGKNAGGRISERNSRRSIRNTL